MFVKGKSGNPGGRSKQQCEFERKCREYMDEKGWETLLSLANDSDKKMKAWAIDRIMDRAYGKPKESVDVTTRDETTYSPDSVADAISELISGEASKGVIPAIATEGTA